MSQNGTLKAFDPAGFVAQTNLFLENGAFFALMPQRRIVPFQSNLVLPLRNLVVFHRNVVLCHRNLFVFRRNFVLLQSKGVLFRSKGVLAGGVMRRMGGRL